MLRILNNLNFRFNPSHSWYNLTIMQLIFKVIDNVMTHRKMNTEHALHCQVFHIAPKTRLVFMIILFSSLRPWAKQVT